MRLKVGFLIAFFILFRSFACGHESRQVHIAPDGITVIESKSEGCNVQVKIKTHRCDKKEEKCDDCASSGNVHDVVSNILIFVNGKAVYVPRDVYCSMSNLGSAWLVINPKQDDTLVIIGGDGASAFKKVVTFDADMVERTASYALIDESDPLEETTYHSLAIN